jgi:hypothetical protein
MFIKQKKTFLVPNKKYESSTWRRQQVEDQKKHVWDMLLIVIQEKIT